MIVYTDSQRLLTMYFGTEVVSDMGPNDSEEEDLKDARRLFFEGRPHFGRKVADMCFWRQAFVVERARMSQYDLLVEMSRKGASLPDRLICLADSGRRFHGQRGRRWSTLGGNIHLSIHLTPSCSIPHFGTGFSILAAVSLVEAVDGLPEFRGRTAIKWVNDIWLDGAKIAGFLAYTQSREHQVDRAVLGIGLNVKKTPKVKGDVYVPRTSSLWDASGIKTKPPPADVLNGLLRALERNYFALLDGRYEDLLQFYRERCLIIGREITLYSDSGENLPQKIASGKVSAIGPHLELFLEGHRKPFTNGRLAFRS